MSFMNGKWTMFWDRLRYGNENTVNKRQYKGQCGEVDVETALSYLPPSEYRVINNGLFRLRGDVTVQIDHILVSRYGVFVIETKNYGGVISEYGDNWKQIWHDKTFSFYSPKRQNESHIKSLMYVLFTKNRSLFHSVVVFPEIADLRLENSQNILKISSLCKYIKSFEKHLLTEDEMIRLYNQINAKNIYSKKNIRLHRQRVEKLYG